jgi:fructose-specific phosphotransferase system IIC component
VKRALPVLLAVACSLAYGYALALLIPRGLLAVLLGLAAGAVICAVILEAWPQDKGAARASNADGSKTLDEKRARGVANK